MGQKSKSYGLRDMYKLLITQHPELQSLPFEDYKAIISSFNKKATEAILDGKEVNLGFGLSSLYIKKVKRKFAIGDDGKLLKPSVDHGATKKLKAEGVDKVVYRTDPYFYRWAWRKTICNIAGKSVYNFKPTKGAGGTKLMLAKLLKNPINFIKFER